MVEARTTQKTHFYWWQSNNWWQKPVPIVACWTVYRLVAQQRAVTFATTMDSPLLSCNTRGRRVPSCCLAMRWSTQLHYEMAFVLTEIQTEAITTWQATTTLYPQNKKSLQDNFILFFFVQIPTASGTEVYIISCSKTFNTRRLTETLYS
jgi:hypothetical protein